jgi:alpha-D-ribose 1-methylphosphonate 5-triphosphate synthase subunit PhnG
MTTPDIDRRRAVMSTLALSSLSDLESAWNAWQPQPEVTMVRGPESGLIMVRGRVGGGGVRFNLGEATVTRATVSMTEPHAEPIIGHAYSLGRNRQKVRLAAIFDALWCAPESRERFERSVLAHLESCLLETEKIASEQAAATEVNFFTMVRGES